MVCVFSNKSLETLEILTFIFYLRFSYPVHCSASFGQQTPPDGFKVIVVEIVGSWVDAATGLNADDAICPKKPESLHVYNMFEIR